MPLTVKCPILNTPATMWWSLPYRNQRLTPSLNAFYMLYNPGFGPTANQSFVLLVEENCKLPP